MKTKKLKQTLLEAELSFEAMVITQSSGTVPKRKGYKYICDMDHVRIEPYAIKEKPLPFCTTCHMKSGKMNRIKLLDRISIPKY
jgi:hypothetical protein